MAVETEFKQRLIADNESWNKWVALARLLSKLKIRKVDTRKVDTW